MSNEIKFVGYLFLYKKIVGSEKLKEVYNDLTSCSTSMDKVYIFNFSGESQDNLVELLQKYNNIEYANIVSKGQAANYKMALEHATSINANYATILETGYFYEDTSYHEIKKRIVLKQLPDDAAVITPIPVLTCESKNDIKQEYREIKGCHLTGTFINVDIYKQTPGIYEGYYQTTFDYDYCLSARKQGFKIILLNNLILKNRNFTPITRKILGRPVNGYRRDIYDTYYETRNRLYLWDKFKDFDPEYIKLDKKQQAQEFKEMRVIERDFKDKKEVIRQAREDYAIRKMGQAFNEIKY